MRLPVRSGRSRPAYDAAPVLVGLVLVLASGLVGGPAYADRVSHVDAAHDVRETLDGSPVSTAAPRRREPDILRVTVAHTLSQVRLRIRLAQLTATSNQAEIAQIVTPDFTAGVYVTRIPGLGVDSVSLIRGAGRLVDCSMLRHSMDVERAVIRVVVPRGCLDSPAWVRVGFAMSRTTADYALTDDGLSSRLGGAPALTRRLYPG